MEDRQLETYFTSIKEDFNRMDEKFEAVDKRFDRQDAELQGIRQGVNTMLELMKNYDLERREVKAALWEHDRRLAKLEQR